MSNGQKAQPITMAQVAEHRGGDNGAYTVIRNQVYDITDFIHKHPGGSVIRIAAGRDGTALFESYHPGSKTKRVDAVLSSGSGPKLLGPLAEADQNKHIYEKNYDKFYLTVRERVEAYMKEQQIRYHFVQWWTWLEPILSIIVFFLCNYYVTFHGSYLAAVFLGLTVARLGFLMHTGNHAAQADQPLVNRLTGMLMDIAGSSQLIWMHEHQYAHHCDPNEVGKDNDCQIGDPMFRFHPNVKHSWMQKLQPYSTIFGMSFGFIKWFFADFQSCINQEIGSVKFAITRDDWTQIIFFKSFWFIRHIVIPTYYFGIWRALGLAMTFMVVGGQYLENIFIVNHIQDECAFPPSTAHWAYKQVIATANWAGGSHFWNWFSGGLNHQIEHHLFPSMNIYCYPSISPIVKQTCQEFGLPYNNYPSWPAAWFAMCRYLGKLGDKQEFVQNKMKAY